MAPPSPGRVPTRTPLRAPRRPGSRLGLRSARRGAVQPVRVGRYQLADGQRLGVPRRAPSPGGGSCLALGDGRLCSAAAAGVWWSAVSAPTVPWRLAAGRLELGQARSSSGQVRSRRIRSRVAAPALLSLLLYQTLQRRRTRRRPQRLSEQAEKRAGFSTVHTFNIAIYIVRVLALQWK